MKMRLPLLVIAVLGSSLSLISLNANAQQSPPAARPAPPHPRLSPADRAAFFEAHISGLHAGLQLTPEQEKFWPPVEAALRLGQKSVVDRMAKVRNEPRPTDAIAWLRRMSEVDLENGQTLKALADASAPLYQSLTDDQKHRLPFLLHGLSMRGFEAAEYETPVTTHGDHEDEGPGEPELPPR